MFDKHHPHPSQKPHKGSKKRNEGQSKKGVSASGPLQPALPLVLPHFPRDLQSTSPAALPDSLSYHVLGIQSPPKYEFGVQSHPHFGFEVPYLIFLKQARRMAGIFCTQRKIGQVGENILNLNFK